MTIRSLARPFTLQSLTPQSRRVVEALRMWALAMRIRWCPVRTLGDRFGTLRAVAHLRLIVEEIGTAWPDPFCVSPPCSSSLSHDETTVAAMLDLAAAGDRPGFDRELADLLPADERERLFLSFSVLGRVLDG